MLLAIGLPHEIAHGSLRMTLSEETTKEDLDYVVENLKEIVGNLRSMSPLYEDFVKTEIKNSEMQKELRRLQLCIQRKLWIIFSIRET